MKKIFVGLLFLVVGCATTSQKNDGVVRYTVNTKCTNVVDDQGKVVYVNCVVE